MENQVGRIYPNPVKDLLNIDSKVNGLIEIWNSNGQLVMKEMIEANRSYKFNISHLPSGNYLIRFNDKGSSQPIKTIIKL